MYLDIFDLNEMGSNASGLRGRNASVMLSGVSAVAFAMYSSEMNSAFVVPRTGNHFAVSTVAGRISTKTDVAASSSIVGTVAAGAGMSLLAASTRRSPGAKTGKRTLTAVLPEKHESQREFAKLVDMASEILASGSRNESMSGDLVSHMQRFATEEVARGGAAAKAASEVLDSLAEAVQPGLRWAGNAAASMLFAYMITLQPANALDSVSYSEFLEKVNSGDVEMVRMQKDLLTAQFTSKDGSSRQVDLIPNGNIQDKIIGTLAEKKVDVVMQNGNADQGPFDFLVRFAGPIAWLVASLVFLFGSMSEGANLFGMGKSKAKIVKDGDTKTKFADVAGCDGAKEELVEVVDFLKNSSRYAELGAKIPKGALLVGPPGTGKTLLAKAVAGEAGVPFFSISASEFIEIYAGVGASRVRDLFSEAKKQAPCIIFIDEIDAVGRQRSSGGFGQGNDEREQTVNQLLTEMDGFEANNGVVVIAATNRADILDKALVRPGRFDRSIQVDPPDVAGREAILKVHSKEKSLGQGVDLNVIARQTPGMSGADLSNLLNEGAIIAARRNADTIEQEDIANALERIVIGLESKDAVMSEKKKRLVAYHEAGHAILGALVKDYDLVAKISIVPRGPAGGVTIFAPTEERLNSGLYSKEFLENRMCVALGGRLAEELINGIDNVTTGASNDFQQVTQVAKAMVTQLGMSELIGQRVVGSEGGQSNPMAGGGSPPVSQSMKKAVDEEINRIVSEQYARGRNLLKANMWLLHEVAEQLIEQEKMTGEELVRKINEAALKEKLVLDPERVLAAASIVGEKKQPSA